MSKIGASSKKKSDAFLKETTKALLKLQINWMITEQILTLKMGVCSMTGGKHQYKDRSLEDTNRNKASQDHRNWQISPHQRDAFTPANDLALGNKNDHLVGLPLHDNSIKIQATMDTSPLNCNNRQDTISQVNSLGLANYQHEQEVKKFPNP